MTPAELTAAMATLQLTPLQLAAALGVTRRTVYRWQHGNARMTPQTKRLIAAMLREKGESA
jgi:DNA-binding transcriptional regulator YiaG